MEYDLNSYSNSKGKKNNYKKNKRKPKTKFGIWWSKRKKWQKATIISAISLLLVVAIVMLSVHILLSKINTDENLDRSDLGFTEPLDADIYNIALFGIDTRDEKTFEGNSDSIMILSINTKDDKIKVISVMRDTLVPIEKNGKTTFGKINSAYALGGPQLAIKTLNTLFGLDISDYATVNFFGMSDIIDAVGGIDVELTKDEIVKDYGLNTNLNEQCFCMGIDPKPYFLKEPGMQHLNGIQAVAYARIRHIANAEGTADDYGRTDRQRLVMKLLLDKALQMPVTSYPSFVSKVLPYVRTSLSESKILSLAQVIAKKPAFEQARIPETEYQINGDFRPSGIGSCVYYNLDYAGKIIRAFIYDNMPTADYMELNGIDKTEWYKGSAVSGRSGGNGNSGNGEKSGDDNGDLPQNQTASENNTDVSGTTSHDDNKTGDVSSDTSSKTEGGDNSETQSGTVTPADGDTSQKPSETELIQ